MLTRRHIRAKVMQSVYAFVQSGKENIAVEQKNMLDNIDQIYDLYILMLNLLIDIVSWEKNILTRKRSRSLMGDDYIPDSVLASNLFVIKLASNKALKEYSANNSLTWADKDEYISIILKEIKNSDIYKKYSKRESRSFNSDKNLMVDLFRDVIAPNEKIHEHIESESIAWIGDMHVANSMAVKTLTYVFEDSNDNEDLLKLYKDEEDIDFAKKLFMLTIKNSMEYEETISAKTPDWDKDRIATLDLIMMEMAVCEFLNFPSIPAKVSINEYLEISKDFSTPKSRIFINGVLDKTWRELDSNGLIKKTGRGLQ